MSAKRKWLIIIGGIVTLPIVVTFFILSTIILIGISKDKNTWREPNDLQVDASHLNPIHVNQVVHISPDSAQAVNQLREVMQMARSKGLKVSVAGARHSMGGQTAYSGGIVVDMLSHNRMRIDSVRRTNGMQTILHVQSGARWSDVLPFLDTHGYSVRVMQSNNPFTVGGTLSVNAHGWQHNEPPFASSVQAFQLFTADGVVKTCSRSENHELFRAVIGGYGLFGVVLDIDLRVMRNELYRAEHYQLTADKYPQAYYSLVDSNDSLGLVYGRLSVAPSSFLKEALLTRFVRQHGLVPRLTKDGDNNGFIRHIARYVFLAGVGNGFGKEVRWQLEKIVGGESGREATRNHILNDPIDVFENHDSTRTQLLQEYFVPRDSLEPFLARARSIIPSFGGDILNVTVRSLTADSDSYLNYAHENVFSLVMLFSQPTTSHADSTMRRMTITLIEAALVTGGTYYLPYRLHATREQFLRAYPMALSFFALKKRFDPDEIFQNQFYREYGHSKD